MDTNKPIKEKLTSTEVGKLWAIYGGNTMSKCVLNYFLHHIDDEEIKKVVDSALNLSESILQSIKEIFVQENFPIPIGLTEEDVNLDAPRLFSNEFYLYYLRYTGKVGLNMYSMAVPIVTREDIRDFFIKTLNSTVKLLTEVNATLMAKGLLMKPPVIPIPEQVDFVKKQNYLNGFFGDIRPLHALEIAHLYDNIDNNVTSKAILIGFSQVAKNETIRDFFIRGKVMTNKHVESCSSHLQKGNLPSPPLLDHLVSESTISPFSDKLMLYHKIDMFSMKIRSYANALSLNGRRDIGGMYAKFLIDIRSYVDDGANILIDRGWMEQPPKAVDREQLASE
jgi:hypothetical protein